MRSIVGGNLGPQLGHREKIPICKAAAGGDGDGAASRGRGIAVAEPDIGGPSAAAQSTVP